MYVCMYVSLCFYTIYSSAPGPVSNLMGRPTLTTVMLTWSPPLQRNGIISSYTVTYRVNGSDPVTRNTDDPHTTTFTISSLFPQTTISNISIRASTGAGPGPEITLEDVVTLIRPREYSRNILTGYPCLDLNKKNITRLAYRFRLKARLPDSVPHSGFLASKKWVGLFSNNCGPHDDML